MECFTGFQKIYCKIARMSFSTICFRFRTSMLFLLVLLVSRMSNGQQCDNSGSFCQTPIQNLTIAPNVVNLTASSTCGVPLNTVYSYPDTAGVDVTCSAGMFPQGNMLDFVTDTFGGYTVINPVLNTYWQSENTLTDSGGIPLTEYVILNFTNSYLIRSIGIMFITPPPGILTFTDMRPRAMQFLAWNDASNSWIPWRYYADNCLMRYGSSAIAGSADTTYGGLVPVCMQKFYSGDDSTFLRSGTGLQQVTFNPAYEFTAAFQSDVTVQRHFTTSALKFQFDYPAQTIPKLSYYAIAALAVEWQCECYGHASACVPGTGQCQCQHNTMGTHCEQCLPGFNNRPWAMGVVTLNSSLTSCQDCNCSGYSASCHYDPLYGQGICDNCTNHTSGNKCESCVLYYYVSPNWNASLTDVSCVGIASPPLFDPITYNCYDRCIPCSCSNIGTDPLSSYLCDASSGNCRCKENVQGRACDTCKDGFWNLDASNFQGCSACNCDPRGSLYSMNYCNRLNGTCICKNFTQGARCDGCITGYFNIDINNPFGCSLCDCDVGASIGLVCPTDTGACACKTLISGRTCRDPVPGFFGPSLDYLTFDAEFSPNVLPSDIVERYGAGDPNATNTGRGFVSLSAQRSLLMSITVPFTSIFTFVVRYESSALWPGVQASLQLSNPAAAPYSCGTAVMYQATQQFTVDFPAIPVAGAVVVGTPCLLANIPYTLRLTFPASVPPTAPILIDSAVFIPSLSTSTAYSLANDSVKAQMTQCSVVQQSVNSAAAQSLSCPLFGYSVMVDKFGQAVGCACNSSGSLSTTCSPMGGQCPCLPNVFLRDCSQCKVNCYGFGNPFGCTACNCNPTGSVKSACDQNGVCTCRPNVVGNQCSVCIPQYWGVFTGNGCQPCTCNMAYAVNNSCMDSGQCYCLPGVGGINCDRCADGFYQLTPTGCTECGCSLYGSQTINCVLPDGHCICKARTFGLTCSTCQDGYFGLGPWGNDGCIPCFCSGHSTTCSSAFGWYQVTINTRLDLFNDAVVRTNEWTAQDQLGNPISVTNPTLLTTTGVAVRLMTIQTNYNGTMSYFVAPAVYLGDKRSAYGQNLTLSVIISTPLSVNVTVTPILSASGDVFLQGTYTSYTLVASYPTLPQPNIQADYSFRLHESVWFLNSSTSPTRVQATYQQMAQVLAAIQSIQIRASVYQLSGLPDNSTIVNSSLIFASLTFANSSAPVSGSQTLVSNVEQCVCPVGYQGQFCESCAPGYTRQNPANGIFSPCIQCFCNNHDIPGTTCNPDTGACSCMDNTMGIQCDQCINGYYGYPISGRANACQFCMCPGNVPLRDVNAFASTCHNDGLGGFICDNCTGGSIGNHCDACSYGYFGTPTNISNNNGMCQDCSSATYCNGNAGYNQTCNSTTGDCLSCGFNTTGRHCDTCQANFKGSAILRTCTPCNCNSSSQMTGDCDKLIGTCLCKPNVISTNSFLGNCDTCLFGYFNYSNVNGCMPCNCSPIGSNPSASCDQVNGTCSCYSGYTGIKCDTCAPGNYYLNGACVACGCNIFDGSTNNSVCDPVTGQCPCNPGFTGRICNMCEAGKNASLPYIGNLVLGSYPNCLACGMCYDNLAGMISQLGVSMVASYGQIMNLSAYSYQNANYDTVLGAVASVAAVVNNTYVALNQTQAYYPVVQDLLNSFNLVASNISDFSLRATTNNLYILIFGLSLQNLVTWTGSIQVAQGPPPIYLAPSDVNQMLLSMKLDQDSKFNYSTSLYQNINSRISIMSNVDGTINGLQTRVGAALALIGISVSARSQVDARLNTSAVSSNAVQLFHLSDQVNNGLSGLLSATQSHVNDATYFQNLANNILLQMSNISLMSDVLVYNRTIAVQSLNTNATLAQIAANSAIALIYSFANTSLAAKQSISGNVISLAGALKTLANGSLALSSGTQTMNNILSTALDALTQQVTSLTQQIGNTVVSMDKVTAINNMATQSLQLATNAQQSTQAAVAQVQSALSLLNFTQSNITAAQTNQLLAQNNMASAISTINYINSVISSVSQKASSANDLATRTNNNITTDMAAITTIQQTYPQLTVRITTARSVGQLVNQSSVGLATIIANGITASNTLQGGISTKNQIIAQQQIALQSIALELNSIQQALSDLSIAYNLPGLQQAAIQGVRDIQSLNNDVSILQVQLNQIGAQIDALPVNSTFCNVGNVPAG